MKLDSTYFQISSLLPVVGKSEKNCISVDVWTVTLPELFIEKFTVNELVVIAAANFVSSVCRLRKSGSNVTVKVWLVATTLKVKVLALTTLNSDFGSVM